MDSSYVRSNCIYCLARWCENCFVFTNYFLLTQFTAEDLVSHLLVAILSFSVFLQYVHDIFFSFFQCRNFNWNSASAFWSINFPEKSFQFDPKVCFMLQKRIVLIIIFFFFSSVFKHVDLTVYLLWFSKLYYFVSF